MKKRIVSVLVLLSFIVPAQWTFLCNILPSAHTFSLSAAAAGNTVVIAGKEFDPTVELLDLSGIVLDSTEELEAALPSFPNLKQVDMCGCGICNEEMEALNQRYEGIKFVWTVTIRGIQLRTDATAFMPTKHGYHVSSEDCQVLQYCHDLIWLDLGHMSVKDCSFLYGTPKLKCLILADTPVSDLRPISHLTDLEFLELFFTKVSDYWLLTNCSSLKDLNVCYSPALDNVPFSRMTGLHRLWIIGSSLSTENQNTLRAALPDTQILFHSLSSTDKGWRSCSRYFAMRDAFGMPYNTY